MLASTERKYSGFYRHNGLIKRIVQAARFPPILVVLYLLTGCWGTTHAQLPIEKKYPVEVLRRDFTFMRRALEEAHPSLYRYVSRDSLNRWFTQTEQQLDHPMTELEFRRSILPVLSRIGCGHTSLAASKGYEKYVKKHRQANFPLEVVIYQDRLYVTANHSTDTSVHRGLEIKAIDRKPATAVLQRLTRLITSDGYNQTFQKWVISNAFPSYYRLGYGSKPTYAITLSDSSGHTRVLKLHVPKADSVASRTKPMRADTSQRRKVVAERKRPNRLGNGRVSLRFGGPDSAVAVLNVTTFSGIGFRRQYRKLFGKIREKHTRQLILDLRGNTGGSSMNSLKLVSYFANAPFKGYSQIDALVRQVSFNKQLGYKFWRFWMRNVSSYKTDLGTYRRRSADWVWKPARKNHFADDVYILTNGATFSAASICASLVKKFRPATTVIGRETGGGRNGCSAYTTPYLTLPETELRLRFPLYKIVLPLSQPDEGHGVIPDVPVVYTVHDGLAGKDLDLAKAYELITAKQKRPEGRKTVGTH